MIAEINVIKFNRTVANFHNRRLRIFNIRHFIQNLDNTLVRSLNHYKRYKDHSQVHNRRKHLSYISKEADKLAAEHVTTHNKAAAKPRNGNHSNIHNQLHNRHHKDDELFGMHLGTANIVGSLAEFLFLKFATDICLNNTDSNKIFLNCGVHAVHSLHHLYKSRMSQVRDNQN